MTNKLVFLTVPGLRHSDLQRMQSVQKLIAGGSQSRLEHSFPCVTWPSQANMLTGCPPSEHGVVANGFYWRDKQHVEMWTAWNEVIERPQIWDLLRDQGKTSAAWFPMLSKGCGADYVCMPAPIHQPDGSEDLWCYTKPQEFYGELLEQLDHFPLKHFWGPLANILSSKWIADSAVLADRKFSPDFFYVYLPHLDYAAQKNGPDSEQALLAVAELDELIGRFAEQLQAQNEASIEWTIASEYIIKPVSHVSYPNRVLRERGLLSVKTIDEKEELDLENSKAWALVDHQFSHVFVKDADAGVIAEVKQLFDGAEGIAAVYDRAEERNEKAGTEIESISPNKGQGGIGIDHPRSGEVILVSTPDSWQAYYWWLDDANAPDFARTVDIHRKPGYDPVELHFDMATRSVPLDATLIKGSHGAPAENESDHGVIVSSAGDLLSGGTIKDFDIRDIVLNRFC